MNKNLTSRSVFIVLVLLAAVIGIIGFPTSVAGLVQNVKHNIRLGLDLKGGSYLVLEVQVQDAVKGEAEQVIEQLTDAFRKQNITYASLSSNDPQTVEDAGNIQIDIKGVAAGQANAVRSVIADGYTDWVLTSVNSSDYYLR